MNFNLDEEFLDYEHDVLNADNSIKPLNGVYHNQKVNQPFYPAYNGYGYPNYYAGAEWYYNLGKNIAKSLYGGKNGAYNFNAYPLQNNVYNNYAQGANYMQDSNFYYDEKANCVVIGNQPAGNYASEEDKYIKIEVGGTVSVLVKV